MDRLFVVFDENKNNFVALDPTSGGYPYNTDLQGSKPTARMEIQTRMDILKRHFSEEYPNVRIRELVLK